MKTKTFFKWLCCSAILLIASVQPAWTNGVKGAWDGWTEHPLSNNSVSFNITTTGTFEFGYQEGDSYLRNSGTMTRSNCSGWHFEKGSGNCKLEVDKVGFYTFTFGDWEEYSKDNWGRTLSVTYPDGGFYDLYVECEVNGKSSSWQKSDGDKNFGDVTSFIIKRAYIKLWDNFGQNNTAWSKGGALGYKYNGGSSNYVNTGTGNDNAHWKGYDSSHPNNYEFFNKTAASNDLVRLVNDGISTKKNSGNYTIEVWGKVNSTTNGWGDAYLKNGDNNFKWTFTILPPAVSSFAVSATSMTYGGDGSQANPYLVQHGSTLTLSASGSKEHGDANSSLEVKFGDNSYSATTTHNITVNSTTKKSIEVKGKYRNSTASLDGAESTKTIYYQAVYTGLTAVASPAAAVSSTPTISAEYTSSSVNVGAGTVNTGYQFKNWSSDNGSFGSTTTASTTFTPNANSAVATANYQIEVTFDKKGHGESIPTAQWIDYNGKVTNPGDLSEAGWEFGGWYKENTCTNQWDFSSDVVTSPITLYAKWTQSSVYYTITKGVNDGVMGSITSNAANESKVLSGSNITFTAHPNDGYEVVAWYTDAACTEGEHDAERTTYSQVINGNATVYVKFKETKHAVTINKGTGISSVTPSGEQQVGNVNPVGISATVATGYTWSQWNTSGGVTVADANANPTTIKATGTGTVTPTATEKTVTLTPIVNDDMGTVSGGGSVGIATGQTITANKKSGYKFDHWELSSNLIIQGKTVNDNSITVKTNGDGEAVSAQAVFVEDLSSEIYVEGDNPPFGGWSADAANEMLKTTGHSTSNDIYYYFTTTKVDEEAEFKLYDKNHNPGWIASSGYWWYSYCTEQTFDYGKDLGNMKFIGTVKGDYVFHYNTGTKKFDITYPDVYCLMGAFNSWSSTSHPFNITSNQVSIDLAENTEYAFRVVYQGKYYRVDGKMTSANCTDWYLYNDGNNKVDVKIQSAAAGTYTFTFDPTTKQLSVSYPGEDSRMVTVDNGETQKDVEVKEVTETPLVASQYLNGMRFNGWVVTNSEGVVQENKITINTPTSCSTHMHGAKENGLIVKATYTTQGIVYLDKQYIKGDWPGDVFVYFYKGAYWDDTNKELGSGSKQTDANCISDGKQMTRVNDKSDIYYYDYSGDNLTNRAEYISFVDQREDKYDNFVACQAIYRGDFQECSPMFVPRNWKYYYNRDAPKGRAVYYQEGYWRTYNSTDAGLSLHFWKGSVETVVPFTSESKNDNTFTAKITINDALGDNSYFKLRCCGGAGDNRDYWYGCNSNMSATSCSNYKFYSGNRDENANCGIGLTSTGDYIFNLSLADGQVFVSVEYPLSNGDYRLVSVTDGKVHDNGKYYKPSTDREDIASFFITNGQTTVVKLQYCTDATSNPTKWADVDGKSVNTSSLATGIYNFTFTQSNESKTVAESGLYDGDFYIRTAIAPGGWDAYLGTDGNTLPYIEYGLDDSQPFKFTHAYTNWVEKDKNVKFCIANDYSLCISDTLVGDDIIGHEVNADWLKNGANIRFMWNKNTNALSRAYISGSTNDAEKFLMLENTNDKMYNKAGNEQIDELKFDDKNNWVYQADIQAQPGCEVRLTAQYTIGTTAYKQYFIGSETESKEIISGTGDKKYKMRAVYDFKTNRLTAGWIPDDETIDTDIKLGGDMLLVREHQGNASQITFGTKGSVSDIHHIYSVLTIKKDVMLGQNESGYTTAATNADYERTMYWISFPFDVKISEVFGVDGYGKKWIMQRYNGEKRAEIGWFAETETFWEYLAPTSTLQAYKGYLLILNANYFNTNGADVWKNSATEANFYFPSAEKNIGIINKSFVDVPVPAHVCGIDRPFADDANKNHKITDSYWNVIGVPAFQDAPAVATLAKDCNLKSYYKWNSTNNTYDVETVDVDKVTFKTMHAYMVQFGGTLKWTDVSVVNNPTQAPYAYADAKNYRIELFFNGNGAEDHTYINLADGASTDFVLNEDMMKIDNAGVPNIYSFAGAYDVAYNETTFDNQTVMLGVSAPKDGSYTFAMPKDFSGKAVLVDLESGEATDLNLSDYTVDLDKGTYNNRFQLLLEVEAKAPTNMRNVDSGLWNVDGKTKKLFINDNIYLINAGRIYNVLGVGE